MNKQPKFTIYNVPLATSQYPIKATNAMKPEGVTIHETDNNASARNEIAYMQRNSNVVSFHIAVDEKEIIQGLPLDRNAWHSGDGNDGFGNRKTIAIETCKNYRVGDLSDYYKARAKTEEVVGWLLYVNGWDESNIYTHNDHNGKNCPRITRQEGYLPTFKANAIKHRDQYINGKSPVITPSKPSKGKLSVGDVVQIKGSATTYGNSKVSIPQWVKKQNHKVGQINSSGSMALLSGINSWININDLEGYTASVSVPKPAKKSTKQLADEVMRGMHGSGQARKDSLGSRYGEVQDYINGATRPKPSTPSESYSTKINRLVNEVMMGKHGSGDARRKSLGSDYEAVQNKINGGSAGAAPAKPTPAKPVESHSAKINRLVDEVMLGKHGSGDARKKSLGKYYSEVQDKINGVSSSKESRSALINRLVNEVLLGKHGSGAARRRSLGAYYDEVQDEINRRY